MTKLQNIFYYVFILMPICFVCGLGIILIDNKAIVNFQFEIKKFKTRKQIDKDSNTIADYAINSTNKTIQRLADKYLTHDFSM